MMSRIRISILAFSALLLMGHSAMPHMHHGLDLGIEKVTVKIDFSLADLLRATLSANLGQNHLKVFKTHEHKLMDQEQGKLACIMSLPAVCIAVDTKTESILNLNLPDRPFHSSRSLRAPPRTA